MLIWLSYHECFSKHHLVLSVIAFSDRIGSLSLKFVHVVSIKIASSQHLLIINQVLSRNSGRWNDTQLERKKLNYATSLWHFSIVSLFIHSFGRSHQLVFIMFSFYRRFFRPLVVFVIRWFVHSFIHLFLSFFFLPSIISSDDIFSWCSWWLIK